MTARHLIALVVFTAIAVATFAFGQYLRDDDRDVRSDSNTVSSVPSPARSPAPVAAPASTETESAAPEDKSPFKYDHFRVGNRNIKALLSDGQTMWIGTSGGVIQYDVKMDDYKLYDNRSGLLSNGVFHLSKVGSDIWIGTYGGGLTVYNPESGTWRNYNVPNGLGDAFIYDALKTSNGDIWIATWSGANRIIGGDMDDPTKWELYTVENTGSGLPNDWVYGLAEGKNGEIWMATEGGLARFADEQWSNWSHKEGLGADYDTVKNDIDFKNDPGSKSSHHAVQKLEQGLEDVSVAYNPNYVIALLVDDDGRVWTGTWGAGLSVFDGSSWRTFTKADGLPSNHVFTLTKDDRGKIWIGTNAGVARYDQDSFTAFTKQDGLFSDVVFSLAFADDGTTWVGSFGGVARFYDGLGVTRLETNLRRSSSAPPN